MRRTLGTNSLQVARLKLSEKKILLLKIKNALFLQKRIFFLRLIYMCDLAAFVFASKSHLMACVDCEEHDI